MKRRVRLSTLGLVVGLGIVVGVGALTYRHLSALEDMERWVQHTHEVLDATQAMVIAVGDAGRARRIFAVSRDEADLEPYRSALARIATSQTALRRLISDNPEQQRQLDQLDQGVAQRRNQLEASIQEARSQSFSAEREALQTNAAVLVISRMRALSDQFEAEERRLLNKRQAALLTNSELAKRIMLLGFGASFVSLLFAFLLLRREFLRRLQSEAALAERERRFATILNSIGDGVIATDAAGAITHMNPVAEQLTGWPLGEAAGQPFAKVFNIISEKTRTPEPDPVARVLNERVKIGLSNHSALIARDGVERPIADSAAPILDGQGRLQGGVLVFRDVTDTKAVETRFRHLIEVAPDAIVIVDSAGRITIANDQASVLFGYPDGELLGKPVEALIPERHREGHAEHRRGYQEAPRVRAMGAGMQLFARRKNGSLCPVEVSLSPLDTPEGKQVIAAVRDVTQRRELERFRDEYVGYISHDLKNPLSIIVLQTHLLSRLLGANPPSDAKHALDVIAESAAFIDRLVRELLEMAYVESDQIEIQAEPVELAPFLQSVLERSVATAERARVHLEIVEPATVSAERRRIERVLVNFVQNAIKYSPPDSPIRIRLEVHDDRAVVSVIDAGPGLAPEERAYVFDKYKRTASAKSKEGLGLGLYISRKIIEAHGGEIGVDSTPGQGATFFIRLPRIAAAPKPASPDLMAPPSGDPLRGLKVLLVDDEVNAVSALSMLLSAEGLEVISATRGEQALKLAAAKPPDVAVVDVKMPGMSGLELLARLRERQPGLPLVIMSGFMAQDAGIAQACESVGATYVGKPVDVDELLRTLGRLFPAGVKAKQPPAT